MKLTADESRALGFIALLIGLSIGARLLDRPEPIALDAPAVDVAALEAASRDAIAQRGKPATPLAVGERVDPNTALLDELRRLPRMTRPVAERIVADRERNGGYRSLADLGRVPGVGPASLAAWSAYVTLPATAATEDPTNVVDVNRASARELERLPGIGPALALRVIALRDSLGGFRSVEQLEQVRGIGPVLMAKLEPLVRVGR